LNFRPRKEWMISVALWIDDPKDADVLPNGRFRNLVCEGTSNAPPGAARL